MICSWQRARPAARFPEYEGWVAEPPLADT